MGKYDLEPLAASPHTYKMAAFDIEGTGEKGGFILGAIYTDDGSRVFTDPGEMRRTMLHKDFRSTIWFAHNLEYDWGCLFQDYFEGWAIYRLGSRVIRAEYRDDQKHIWRFWDTGNLSAFQSLAALGEILHIPKLEMPEYLKDLTNFTMNHTSWTDERIAEISQYCIRDARICYEYARYIQERINSLGGQIKTTLAATALDLFRRSYLTENYYVPPAEINDLARHAYYGGRTEVYVYGQSDQVYQYDVHSMYPSVMMSEVYPDTNTMCMIKNTSRIGSIFDFTGITSATVIAPEMHIPILPVRINKRLVFPTGQFSGVWCHNELAYALGQGYEIKHLHWQLIFKKTCRPFSDYVTDLYSLKQRANENSDPAFFVYKILLNSLYGKFGQRVDDRLSCVREITDPDELIDIVNVDIVEWGDKIIAIEPLTNSRQPNYIIVPWAAYVTAYARIKLHRTFTELARKVAYTDTDCCITSSIMRTSDELGGWGLEIGPARYQLRAEKYYRYAEDGEDWQYKKAGVPRQLQSKFWGVGRVNYKRPSKIGESLAGNKRFSVWQNQQKSEGDRWLKRRPQRFTWSDDETIETRPWTYDEAVAHYEGSKRLPPWRKGSNLTEVEIEQREVDYLRKWREQQ